MKSKEENLNELVNLVFKIDDVLQQQQEKTERLSEMARLAKQGLKDSVEFKRLDSEFRHPKIIDASEYLYKLRIIVKKLRKQVKI